MGLFDKFFGRGATAAAKQPGAQAAFALLKQKYNAALTAADQQGVRVQSLQVQNGKLHLIAVAPSEQAKNAVWDAIKRADPAYSDLVADIVVAAPRPTAAPPPPVAPAPGAGFTPVGPPAPPKTASRTYTVKPGDTLSKISREHYGDADEYMRIFYANRDKLNDPDLIKVGQQLTIPPDDDL